jgi:hypothetical protein
MQSGARQLGAVKFAELCHWLEHELPSETPWLGYARIRQLERILAQIAQQMQLNG